MPQPGTKEHQERLNPNFYEELAQTDPAALEALRKEFQRTRTLPKPLVRRVQLNREAVNVDERTVTFSYSSEEPVERWFGLEVLGHAPGECDTSRMDAAAPYLFNHNWDDQVGVVIKNWTDGQKNLCTVKLSRSARGEEFLQDHADGIRINISVGYYVSEYVDATPQGTPIDAPRTYRAVKWTPYEVSNAPVPADITVGQGRALPQPSTRNDMTEQELAAKAAQEKEAQTRMLSEAGDNARKAELARTAEIIAIEERFGKDRDKVVAMCRKALKDNTDVNTLTRQVLEEIGAIVPVASADSANGSLGLRDKERKQYSLRKAMEELASDKGQVTGFEAEMHQEMERRGFASKHGGLRIPYDVLGVNRALVAGMGQRDLTVNGSNGEASLVNTQVISFVEMLRNKAKTLGLGVQLLSGLKDDIMMPRQVTASTLYWIGGEGTAPTESQPSFGQINMSPKSASALVEVGRKLLIQSDPSVDALVTRDLMAVVMLGMDAAILNGTGVNGQPQGILNTTGIGSQSGTSLAWAGIVGHETNVATGNADVASMAFLATPGVRGLLKQRTQVSGGTTPPFIWEKDNKMNGYNADVTNQLPTASLIFGDWATVVAGLWGPGMELTVNPYRKSAEGLVTFQPWLDMDVAVRQVAALSASTSIT